MCPLGCDIAFRAKGEAVAGPEFCANRGPHGARLCARGLYGTELLNHYQRVATPLVRNNGVLRETSWEAATARLASAVLEVIEGAGSEAIALVTDPTHSTEELEAIGQLAGMLGTRSVSCMFEPQDWPLVLAGGSADASSLEEANCIIVFGDVFFTHPVLARVVLDAKYTARGNSLFVVDPRRSNTAWFASEHVQNRPGTEALVLACLLKALKDSGKLQGNAPGWLDSTDDAVLLEASGVSGDVIARMSQAFALANRAAVVVAPPARGMTDVALVGRLAGLLAGTAEDQKSCILLPSGGNVRGAQEVVARNRWKAISTVVADLEAGKYRALLSFGADILEAFPSKTLSKAVSELDLTASFSLFKGQIEAASSVVLAGASWLESDGSAALFDGTTFEWKSIGAPSWGCRTLVDVVSMLETTLATTRTQPSRDAGGTVDDVSFEVSDSEWPMRLASITEELPAATGEELVLITLPATAHSGAGSITRWITWAAELFPAGFVEISTGDAATRGISDGERVIVAAQEVEVELCARVTDRLCTGVAAVPSHDVAARGLFSWKAGRDGWFSTGPASVRVYRKQQQ